MCAREGTWGANVRPAASEGGQSQSGRSMGRERLREEGLEQRQGAASSLAKPGDLGVRWNGGSKPVTPSLSSPAYSPQGRRWPREACPALVICLSVCLSIYSNLPALGLLFWVPGSYEASEVQEKKKNPASQKPTDSRISASLAPGLGDSARPHSARDGGNPVPVL